MIKKQKDYYDDFGDYPMDVNGDGYLDVVSGGWFGGKLTWRVTHPQREPKSEEERVQKDKLQQLMDRVKRAAERKRPSDGGES